MTTFQMKMARPNEGEMELFWKLFRAAARVEDRWNVNTVPFLAEDLQNDDLSRAQKLFLFRAWQVLVDGHGGFGRLMGAFDTYVHNFQNAGADYVDLKPSLQEIWGDGQILPVVLEAYEEAKAAIPHHNGLMQLSQELAEAKRHIAALEQQLAAERGWVVKLPERTIDAVCLKAAEIHNRGRGLDDDDAQGVIDSIREILDAGIPVEGE